jgi:hypothetical protein
MCWGIYWALEGWWDLETELSGRKYPINGMICVSEAKMHIEPRYLAWKNLRSIDQSQG